MKTDADYYRWWRDLCIEWLAFLESVADTDTDATELQAIRDAVAQLTDPDAAEPEALLWPVRWTQESHDEARRLAPAPDFRSEYHQTPAPPTTTTDED